jgi:transcriptional regulator with XRE-family HTH domain
MARRARGFQPSTPHAFGYPDVHWVASDEHDPVYVAALHLQHMVLQVARRLGGKDLSEELSQLLGVSLRTAQRILSGEHLLGVKELIELACLFGDDVLGAIPRSVGELFPEEYRSLLGPWRAGTRQLPSFHLLEGPATIAWPGLAAQLAAWLNSELGEDRSELLGEQVVAHRLAVLLAKEAISSNLIMVSARPRPAIGWMTLEVLTRVSTVVAIGCLLDPVDNPVGRLGDVLRTCYEVLDYDGRRILLLCLGRRMEGQLRVRLDRLAGASEGDAVVVPFQLMGQLGIEPQLDSIPPDLSITVAATTGGTGLRVLILEVEKAS